MCCYIVPLIRRVRPSRSESWGGVLLKCVPSMKNVDAASLYVGIFLGRRGLGSCLMVGVENGELLRASR